MCLFQSLNGKKKAMIKHKIGDSHDEWLKQRNKGLGGSDAGAVMGVNKYKSVYTLWAEKTGLVSSYVPDNEAMLQGRDLEDYVAKRFCKDTGKKVQRSGYSFQSEEYPWMLANIDRKVVGENAGLECKTANIFTQEDYRSGVIPDSYYCQCLHYMAVCGFDRMYLAVLVLGRDFHIFSIDRQDQTVQVDLETLIAAESDFWGLVKSNTPPAIDGSDSTTATLKAINPQNVKETVMNVDALEEILDAREEVLLTIDDLNEKKTALENQIRDALGTYEEGTSTNWKVTFKNNTKVDEKKLKADHPDIYEMCLDAPKKPAVNRSKLKKLLPNSSDYIVPSDIRPLKIKRRK